MHSVLQTVGLFKAYFGGQFDEDAIRNNFVLIYELLDGEQELSPHLLELSPVEIRIPVKTSTFKRRLRASCFNNFAGAPVLYFGQSMSNSGELRFPLASCF
jgi:hypothetical protein